MNPATLRAWRNARGLSRQEAAKVLAVPWRTIETLETGRAPQSALWGPLSRIVELLDAAIVSPALGS